MVALLFGDGSNPVHKVEGLHEVGEGERSGHVVLVDDFPVGKIGKLLVEVGKFFSLQRWNTAAARNASARCEFAHKASVSKLKVSGAIHEMQSKRLQFVADLAQARAYARRR